MKPELWPHQIRAIADITAAIAAGERSLCVTSPTGGGKSRILTDLVWQARERGQRVIVYTNRRLLLEQLQGVMADDGLNFGVRAAGHKSDHFSKVQISSIQTEEARIYRSQCWKLFEADLVLIDEAHANAAETACRIVRDHRAAGAAVVGFTATPIDLGHLYDRLIVAGTNSELRRCGALVPAVTYGPDEPDARHLRTRTKTGEYTEDQVRKAIMTPTIFARVLEWLERLNPNLEPTILFGPDVAGSMYFAEQLNAAGISAAHIDGEDISYGTLDSDGESITQKSTRERRAEILEGSREGRIKVLCNRFVCLDAETEILTESGWTGIDEMTPEHKVANWDDSRVFFEEPSKVIRRSREPEEKMVVLETPRRSIRVTANHLMLYRTTIDGHFLKAPAEQLVNRCIALPVSGHGSPLSVLVPQPEMMRNATRRITANAHAMRQRGFDVTSSRMEATKRISERSALKYRQPSELTQEECEFIGFWIGDGNRNKLATGGVEYRLSQSVSYSNIIARIDHLINVIGVDTRRRIRSRPEGDHIHWSLARGTGFGIQKRRGLFHLEPYLCKDGAALFWGFNAIQFDALLRGLWMADGCPHNNRTRPPQGFSVCGINRQLFDLLQAIAVCRGYRASIRSYKQSNPQYRPLLMLSLTKTDEHRMTKYRLQFEDGWQAERVWCVTSKSGNIIVRRNGSVTVLGNCREGLDLPWLRVGILATVFGGLSSYLQAGGRLLRATPGKDHTTIIDHGGNFWRHGSLNADRQWNLTWGNNDYTRVREGALREKKEPEPIRCPRCAAIRTSGEVCPKCGYKTSRRSRMVVQTDGTLRELTGAIFKKCKTQQFSDTQRRWDRLYYSFKKSGRTFSQARGYFFHVNRYWPPETLANMPLSQLDWGRKVADVPWEELHHEKEFAGEER